MAEIKSTLDLVMQRTRGLRLSPEEREAQRREEIVKKTNGLVQRFLDGGISLDDAVRDAARIQAQYGSADTALMVDAMLERLEPGRDNGAVLALIKQTGRVDVAPFEALLQACAGEMAAAREAACRAALKVLADEHRIWGSAVVALPEGAAGWQEKAAALKAAFFRRLKREREALGQANAPIRKDPHP